MNNQRRKELGALMDRLEDIKADIETLMEQEQEYLDNMPENMQDGEKGERAQSAIDNMGQAISELESAIGSIQVAISE